MNRKTCRYLVSYEITPMRGIFFEIVEALNEVCAYMDVEDKHSNCIVRDVRRLIDESNDSID